MPGIKDKVVVITGASSVPFGLIGEAKRRNRETLNFRSAASAAVILVQILAQSAVFASGFLAKLPRTRQTYTLEYEHWIGIGLLREVCLVDK
jgi:hypothetical protein